MSNTARIPRFFVMGVFVFTIIQTSSGQTENNKESTLSKESIEKRNSINEKLEEYNLSTECWRVMKKFTSNPKTDKDVNELCNLAKHRMFKAGIVVVCSEDNYDKIVTTICDVIGTGITIDNLSPYAAFVINKLDKTLEKTVSDTCKPLVKDIISLHSKTDDQLYSFSMCRYVSGSRAQSMFWTKCPEDNYDEIVDTICTTFHGFKRFETSKLSNQATAILDNINGKIKNLSSSCLPMMKVVNDFYSETDEQIYDMCHFVKGPMTYSTFLNRCSDKEYNSTVKTICDEIRSADKESIDEKSNGDIATIATAMETLEKSLSVKCQPIFNDFVYLSKTYGQVYDLCNLLDSNRGRFHILSVCSIVDYWRIVIKACGELREARKDTSDKRSKHSAGIINKIETSLNKTLSENCKPVVYLVVSMAYTDDLVYGLCDSVKGPLVQNILSIECDFENQNILVNTVCDELEEANYRDKMSENATAIVNTIKQTFETLGVSDKCKSMINVAISLPKTDGQVYDWCNLVSERVDKKIFILSECESEKKCYFKIHQTICDRTKTANKNNWYKMTRQATLIVNTIKEKLENELSDRCKPMIDVAASYAKTNEQVYRWCDAVTLNVQVQRQLLFSRCSPLEYYGTIANTICHHLSEAKKDASDQRSDNATAIVTIVKEKLEKSVSDDCKPFIILVTSLVKTNERVYDWCNIVKEKTPGPIQYHSSCNDEYSGKMTDIICNQVGNNTNNDKEEMTSRKQGTNTTIITSAPSCAILGLPDKDTTDDNNNDGTSVTMTTTGNPSAAMTYFPDGYVIVFLFLYTRCTLLSV